MKGVEFKNVMGSKNLVYMIIMGIDAGKLGLCKVSVGDILTDVVEVFLLGVLWCVEIHGKERMG